MYHFWVERTMMSPKLKCVGVVVFLGVTNQSQLVASDFAVRWALVGLPSSGSRWYGNDRVSRS
jgi:hypothetical protein